MTNPNSMTSPDGPRGFEVAEYRARVARAQKMMAAHDLSALLLSTEPEVRYFTGYLTRFWESPARPWFVIVPASGDPVAVIPSIGAALMRSCWIEDVRTWVAPDLEDDGVTLLAETLREKGGPRIGVPSGHETHLRMPLADYARLGALLEGAALVEDAGITRALRLIKSPAEIAKIRTACGIAGRAFDRVPRIATEGVPLDQVFRRFQMLCLEEGADWVPYLAGGTGQDGYGDVISPASAAPLAKGDIMMLDTGVIWDGYHSDFDRNFSVGVPSAMAASAHSRLMEAVAAGLQAAKPGNTAADIFHAMDQVCTGGLGGSDTGRLGHGLGMQLTEWPSFIAQDQTVIQEGMVLTLEPGVETREGRMMVHEEDIVITAQGAEFLSPRAGTELVVV